eukprot:TRINITY_DN7920_c0_g1_i1.p1 TRINITY_DN7920_c0_g1~~TRINITY_DN7920_c0_g1_i1.p1  ORF type:complete len:487 (-),score=81.57 TRINITY_DN7920_c0_g1_i1:30-1490(-)
MIRAIHVLLLGIGLMVTFCQVQVDSNGIPLSNPFVDSPFEEELMNIMYYSPSPIGYDPLENDVDLYTSYFRQLHQSDLKIMNEINVDTLWLGYWIPNGDHDNFLDLACGPLQTDDTSDPFHYNFSLIITFRVTLQGTAADRTSDKEEFELLLKELDGRDCITIISVDEPPAEELSKSDVLAFFDLITELKSIIIEKTTLKTKLMAGLPIDQLSSRVGEAVLDPTIGSHDFWSIRLDGIVEDIFEDYYQKIEKYGREEDRKKIVPLIRVDSFEPVSSCKSNRHTVDCSRNNDILQYTDLLKKVNNLYSYYRSNDHKSDISGLTIFGYTDEWWRGSLASVGRDIEGCPNANPFAHTSCGVLIPGSDVLSLEYMGMFQITSMPFRFCVKPKISAYAVGYLFENQTPWNREKFIEDFPYGQAVCQPLTLIFDGFNSNLPWDIIACGAMLLLTIFWLLVIPCIPHPYECCCKSKELVFEERSRNPLWRAIR